MSILEIAKIAGVSHTTVARVVNQTGSVSEENIRKVRMVIEQIGYVPKPPEHRRGPRTRAASGFKTGNVAIITSSKGLHTLANSPVIMSVMRGIEETLASHGISMVQGVVNSNRSLPPIVVKGGVDGVIIWPSLEEVSKETIRILSKYKIVYLMTGREKYLPGDRVLNDNEQVGMLAAKYLLRKGHKNVAMIDCYDRQRQRSAWVERWYGFEQTAIDGGADPEQIILPITTPECIHLKVDNEKNISEMLENQLKQKGNPTGIFCTSDGLTATLYSILRKIGFNIGEDVEFVSCNNESSILVGLDPIPASIDICPELIGRKAVEQLRWRIMNPEKNYRILVEVKPKLKFMGENITI